MKEQLEAIRAGALAAIGAAGNTGELEALRVQYLGKKGELTAVLKQMGKLSAEERPVMGQLANAVRADVESAIEQQSAVLAEKALEERLEAEALDITVPGKAHKLGHKHPMYTALDEIKEIFISMGFTVLDGPEVELATYNFDKLNAGEIEFAKAAEKYSEDGSAKNGGDVGWDKLTTFVTEYQDALSGLSDGQMSGLVKTTYGYHIIKCTGQFNVQTVSSIDEVPEGIRDAIAERIKTTAESEKYSEWLTEYTEKADIKINEMPEDVPYNVDMDKALAEGDKADKKDADGKEDSTK